ncbi:transporter substrate-binding domain-containing protein [Methylophaga sp.]|uniref:transporter substrate-binding domain-containing protein n=1 Tax=Methylophaga sp. TaxID=2024840 RepID=UPI003F6A306E
MSLAKIAILVTILTALLAITACDQKAGNDTPLRIGYAIEKPYSYINNDGFLTGQSIETARVIAKKLGYTDITWVQMNFSSLIDRLKNKRIDIIAAGMFVRPDREAIIDFSTPFIKVKSGFLVARNYAEKLRQFNINTEVIRIIVLAGSVEYERLSRISSTTIHIIQAPDIASAKAAFSSGIGDALFLSVPSVKAILADYSNKHEIVSAKAVLGSEVIENVGFAFHPDAKSLRADWDKAATPWIKSQEHLDLIKQFGFSAENTL